MLSPGNEDQRAQSAIRRSRNAPHFASSLTAMNFVRLVRLVDRARADHHGRNAGLREQPPFGAIGHLAVAVAAGKLLGEQGHFGVFRRVEAGELGAVLEVEACFRRDRLHLRFEHVLRVVDHFLTRSEDLSAAMVRNSNSKVAMSGTMLSAGAAVQVAGSARVVNGTS
jgi:hypothetical protein